MEYEGGGALSSIVAIFSGGRNFLLTHSKQIIEDGINEAEGGGYLRSYRPGGGLRPSWPFLALSQERPLVGPFHK